MKLQSVEERIVSMICILAFPNITILVCIHMEPLLLLLTKSQGCVGVEEGKDEQVRMRGENEKPE